MDRKPLQDEFTVVYAVISDDVGTGLHLPFFSRVNLNNTRKILNGYTDQLLQVSPKFAKSLSSKRFPL